MRIERISVADKIEQVAPLLAEHYDEVARNKRVMVLKPNVAAYEQLEAEGRLIGVAAFDGDEIVGYCVTILAPSHLHYADLSYASNDVLFVRKSHRNGSVGLRLMAETERIAKERGARMMVWHAKECSTLDTLLRRKGYGVQDILFSREL